MQSLLTSQNENFDDVSRIRKSTFLQYARGVGLMTKESLKRTTRWTSTIFTHLSSYYPVAVEPYRCPNISLALHVAKDKAVMRHWIVNYHPVRQRSFEPVHEISNNVVCATSEASDQPAHTRSLIRAFASRLSIL